ncbi:polysaccharide pyruvyl transferase family protein [Mesorhizobium koreense]|uniref:polysaccharide pyruvyl transferase family protein n=1 Tax=Mesorhizobium koreense TaxID=3074855 RepID=UPI00287BAE1D|nr:polysaccharide pyruvyl transferase family protein [Mesorhizobium sp. WR6]
MTGPNLKTIGLLWHSANSDNLGIGALTAAHIAVLEGLARDLGFGVRFKILGWRDPGPVYIQGTNVEVVPLRARDVPRPGGLYAAIRSCDLILDISAGDSFADIYGTWRFIFNVLSKAVVLAGRRPLILSPQTIGPFERWWTRWLASLAIRGARKIVTRDALSTAYMREMRLDRKLIEATDLAIRLPFDPPPPRVNGPVRVGLNISGLLFNGGYSQDNMFSLLADYPALARSLCAHFVALPDCELHLVGHVNSQRHAVEDDYRVAKTLAIEFPGVVVAPRFDNPSAAKSYIATMDFFAGSRMHACIAAFSSGVPVLPIAYSRKFSGLFGTLGYRHLADCKTQTAEEISDAVITAYERRGQLRLDGEKALMAADGKLSAYEDVLRGALQEIGRLP